jgi:hypothetical protein
MTQYLLLLYAPDGDEAEAARRWAEMPRWQAVTDELREAGVLPVQQRVAPGRRGGHCAGPGRRAVDGPFAVTKEILAGYYLLDCPHLEVALDAAARLPMAAYGSVEVRPVMTAADIPADPPGIGGA